MSSNDNQSQSETLDRDAPCNRLLEPDMMVNKTDFEIAMSKYIEDKQSSSNMQIWDDNEVAYTIRMLQEYYAAKHGGRKREYVHYNKARLYDIVRSEGRDQLIYKKKKESDKTITIPPTSRYFELITEAHSKLCHGGRDRMRHLLKAKYKIPKWAVEVYLKLCPICQRKKQLPKSGLVVKPITSDHFNQRCQVDLMDFQSVPDGEYKWLMQYQDHLTKYCLLHPLKSKRAEEVAEELFYIFCDYGCPKILQSDNGREFVNQVITELVKMWPDCKVIHGRPRHPQSQGSVERSNADVANMLRCYMTEKKTKNWAKACRIVQYQKNCALHRIIKRSPYEALFGEMPVTEMVELDRDEDADDPEEVQHPEATNQERIVNQSPSRNAEDERAVEPETDTTQSVNRITDVIDDSDDDGVFVDACSSATSKHSQSTVARFSEVNSMDSNNFTVCCICHDPIRMEMYTIVYGSVYCQLCSAQCNIMENREGARLGIKRSATDMLQRSVKKYKKIEIGSSVIVQIPKVDRGPLDHQNVVGKVLDYSNNLYRVGTSNGIIDRWLARNCIESTPFVFTDEIPTRTMSLREIASKSSDRGGQGFKKCSCRSQCNTKRYQCRKSNLKCNSRCHASRSCSNH